ncbi:MAG: hypothetical protein NT007_17670 [Candidatus Kapabacteria bacterium]|nr:hypothetical protein [Candidatus Kapabacteria bacterium]
MIKTIKITVLTFIIFITAPILKGYEWAPEYRKLYNLEIANIKESKISKLTKTLISLNDKKMNQIVEKMAFNRLGKPKSDTLYLQQNGKEHPIVTVFEYDAAQRFVQTNVSGIVPKEEFHVYYIYVNDSTIYANSVFSDEPRKYLYNNNSDGTPVSKIGYIPKGNQAAIDDTLSLNRVDELNFYYDKESNLQKLEYSDVNNNVTITIFMYNQQGFPVSKMMFDGNGKQIYRVAYKYDVLGLLIEEKEENTSEKITKIYRYKYDKFKK